MLKISSCNFHFQTGAAARLESESLHKMSNPCGYETSRWLSRRKTIFIGFWCLGTWLGMHEKNAVAGNIPDSEICLDVFFISYIRTSDDPLMNCQSNIVSALEEFVNPRCSSTRTRRGLVHLPKSDS